MSEARSPGGSANYDIHITETKFWEELMDDIYGPRKGGAIIFVDAENARKGVAKTSGAVAMARLLAYSFGYDIKNEDMTLSGGQYLRRYQEQPGEEQPSALLIDEFVGAGSGDGRRAMSKQNVDFGSAWQMLRTKRVVTLATLPDWNEADPRLQKYADYRLWCKEKPLGYFQPYKVTTPFNSGGSTSVKTKGLSHDEDTRRIAFPNMDSEGDPYYRHISKKKDDLIHSQTWDADALEGEGDAQQEEAMTEDEMERRELTKVAIRLYKPWTDETEYTYEDVSRAIEERTDVWVGKRVREWRNGEHRELVPDPREA